MGLVRGRETAKPLSGEVLPGKASGLSQTIKAVAFDLDGTLYPNYRLYFRLLPQFLLHPFLYFAFSKARRVLHAEIEEPSQQFPSFYDRQAALVAEFLGNDPEKTKRKLERLIYEGWETAFSGIKIFPHLKETLAALRGAGLRLAVLSDFPPAHKLSMLGLEGFFDVVLSTEETGALKPSGIPFGALVKALNTEPGEILYVGNSPRFDVAGAQSAGMNAALIRRSVFSTGHVPENGSWKANFVFKDYRQLLEYILQ